MSTPTLVVTSLNVPPLTDNAIAFANATAWNQYWAGAGFTASVSIADTVTYGVVKSATTIAFNATILTQTLYITEQIDLGNGAGLQDFKLPLASSYDALVAAFNALQADYTALKAALKDAGLISNA